jgi:hypothetical protein
MTLTSYTFYKLDESGLPEHEFAVEAYNPTDAALLALSELGYGYHETETEDETEEDSDREN